MTIFRHTGKSTTGPSTYSNFVAKWDTTQEGSANDTIVLPLVADGTYDFYIDWGDGTKDTITAHNQSEVTHQYSDTGIYTIRLVANDMVGWQFNDSGDDDKLMEIIEWGPLRFVSDDTNLFKGCSNLTLSTTSDPPFNADVAGMFQDCSSLTGNGGNISGWDMSSVTGMNFMLAGCTNLDVDLSSWDVSSIQNAEGFMSGAGLSTMNYDRILSGWSSQAVQSGVYVSFGSTQYSVETGQAYRNALLSSGWIITDGGTPAIMFETVWDTTRVESNIYPGNASSTPDDTIRLPLHESGSYDFTVYWGDGTDDHITTYNQSEVTHQYPSTGIYTVSILGNITGWRFFSNNWGENFSRDRKKIIEVNRWGPLVINNYGPFYSASNLTINASGYLKLQDPEWYDFDVRPVYSYWFQGLDWGSGSDASLVDVSDVKNFHGSFNDHPFDQDLGDWDVSSAIDMGVMFTRNTIFNNGGSSSITGWDVSNVRNMRQMFDGASSFNQPIGSWDVANVGRGQYDDGNGFEYMFQRATSFNQDISSWDISNARNINSMFRAATGFQQNIGNWDVSNINVSPYLFMHERNTSITRYPTANYDNLLIGWASQNVNNGLYWNFGGAKYSAGAAASARQTLINKGWTILDGGQV